MRLCHVGCTYSRSCDCRTDWLSKLSVRLRGWMIVKPKMRAVSDGLQDLLDCHVKETPPLPPPPGWMHASDSFALVLHQCKTQTLYDGMCYVNARCRLECKAFAPWHNGNCGVLDWAERKDNNSRKGGESECAGSSKMGSRLTARSSEPVARENRSR